MQSKTLQSTRHDSKDSLTRPCLIHAHSLPAVLARLLVRLVVGLRRPPLLLPLCGGPFPLGGSAVGSTVLLITLLRLFDALLLLLPFSSGPGAAALAAVRARVGFLPRPLPSAASAPLLAAASLWAAGGLPGGTGAAAAAAVDALDVVVRPRGRFG
jgi:hypothetical protein